MLYLSTFSGFLDLHDAQVQLVQLINLSHYLLSPQHRRYFISHSPVDMP